MSLFTIPSNGYLSQNVQAFYHTAYVGRGNPGNPNYLNTFKNTYNNVPLINLSAAAQTLEAVLREDLPQILAYLKLQSLTVCVVPRAKINLQQNQLLFRTTVQTVVLNQLKGFIDGTNYITRHTNTKTTHLQNPIPNYINNGAAPYPGITMATCNISNNVNGKDILLIDDIYTKTVNIDEDAIEALINNGAKVVAFYAVGYTI
jgi:hypothetical protein